MYGLDNLIGNMFTGAVTPAIGSAITEATRGGISDAASGLFSKNAANIIGKVGGGALGALAGAGLGAGVGALTAGKYGAMGGALTGGMGGGYGGIKSSEIQKSLGFGQSPDQGITTPGTQAGIGATIQNKFPTMQMGDSGLIAGKPNLGNTNAVGSALAKMYPSSPAGGPALTDIATQALPSTDLVSKGLGDKYGTDFTKYEITTPDTTVTQTAQSTQQEPTASTEQGGINLGDYMDIAGKSFLPSVTTGTGFTANAIQKYWDNQAKQKAEAEAAAAKQQLEQWASSLYPKYYANGGPIHMEINSPAGPIKMSYPQWFVKDVVNQGGIGGIAQSYANGGYLNNTMPAQEDPHPQSLIPKATPQPGAAPVRQEVVQSFEHGGLLDGAGDGMSDSIPAEIDGKEPVRVADGEYVVPKHIAQAKEAQLKKMMTQVRSAAHAKKGKQIVQDAAKKAFIHTMSGVKA